MSFPKFFKHFFVNKDQKIEDMELKVEKAIKKKYEVYPGWVTSNHDGQSRFVTGESLIRLYGVDPRECIIVDQKKKQNQADTQYEHKKGMIRLFPRYDGNYELPEGKE